MRNPEKVLNSLCLHSKNLNYKFERLYRILFNEEMFFVAYQRIYAKPGNMTSGTDGHTIDQMSIQRIEKLIESLKDESYKPKPARRVYIPKKNGKMRPLGIPSFGDKLVQEVVRMVLEAIYEGHFEDTSHGFRPARSCHSALKSLQKGFTGAKWFIEGDIKGFFDNISHEVLINILAKRISDERFLRLIRKFLRAGYVEQWTYKPTFSGTPQGGIISPILANIYLDEFDKYIAEYIQKFNKGNRRREHKEYRKYVNRAWYLKRQISETENVEVKAKLLSEYHDVGIKLRSLPCTMELDSNYRRMRYVRYADDFLIGVIGTKAECEQIKADITLHMSERLKLELSAEKTLITNAQDKAKFLGFEISTPKRADGVRNSNGILKRRNDKLVSLNIAKETWIKRLKDYGAARLHVINGKEVWKPSPRRELLRKSDEMIVAQFNSEIRGFYNYFGIANNASYNMWKFYYFMEYSLYKTLAMKHRSSIAKLKKKHQKGKDFVITYRTKKGEERSITFVKGSFKRKKENLYYDATHDLIPQMLHGMSETALIDRLKNGICEQCGEKGKLAMHHVRKLSELKEDTPWNILMLKRRRKTLAVCPKCNKQIQDYAKY